MINLLIIRAIEYQTSTTVKHGVVVEVKGHTKRKFKIIECCIYNL